MAILEVNNVKKIYTTRFGGNQVQALTDVSFSVEKGEYVAIMGESGSGKTTLLNILAALDKATSGLVMLNGKNLSALRDSEVSAFRRENLGFVFQDFNLLDNFNIQDNIFLPLVLAGKNYNEMRVRLMPIAEKLGIKAILGKYPYEVSGGQKQRLCIARALLKKPKILILDDSTSAVDTHTDAMIRKAFREEIPETTKLIIAQRVSSVQDADKIIVLNDGQIDGIGTHEELMENNAIYREVYESQQKGGDADEQ